MEVEKHKQSALQKSLNVWAIIIIAWSVYRAYFKTDLPIWFDEFIAKPIVFITPIVYYIIKMEKKNLFEGLDITKKNLSSSVIVGIIVGSIFFLSGGVGLAIKSKNAFSFLHGLTLSSFGIFFLLSIATSISEEVVSRGFVLKRLYENSKNKLSSSFFASILFFFLHVPILFTSSKIVGSTLLIVMFTDLIFSLAVSFLYLDRKNLALPIIVHAFYNLSFYLFI